MSDPKTDHFPEFVGQDETVFPHYDSHYPTFINLHAGEIGCSCGWEGQWTRTDQVIAAYAEHVAFIAQQEVTHAACSAVASWASKNEIAERPDWSALGSVLDVLDPTREASD